MSTKPNDKTPTDSDLHPDHIIISITPTTKRFLENLAFVRKWSQYEQLALFLQEIPLWELSVEWLQAFRDNLEPQPSKTAYVINKERVALPT